MGGKAAMVRDFRIAKLVRTVNVFDGRIAVSAVTMLSVSFPNVQHELGVTGDGQTNRKT